MGNFRASVGLRGLFCILLLLSFQKHARATIEDNPNTRIQHAKELLGSDYDISIAKQAEKFGTFGDVIHKVVAKSLARKWRAQSQKITKSILAQSIAHEFDPVFLLAVIRNESGFNIRAVGGVGEIGLMQVRPESARWIASRYGLKYQGRKSLFDPKTNIEFGAALLDFARRQYKDQGALYLSAYNMGVVGVEKQLKKNRWPQVYAHKVMDHYLQLYSTIREKRV